MKTLTRFTIVSACAIAGFAAVAGGAVFVHTAAIDVGAGTDGFNSTTGNGANPLSVAFDGTNAYIGGYNNAGAAADVGVVKVTGVIAGGTPALTSLAATRFNSPVSRGIDALAYEATTTSLLLAHDSGSAASSFITRRRAADGAEDWRVMNPLGLRPWAMAIDPIGDGSGPGVAFFANGQGRRLMLKLSDGGVVYTTGAGETPGGIINTFPTVFGTIWRAVAFDPDGNIALSAAHSGGATARGGFGCGLRDSANVWKALNGLDLNATTSSIERDSTGGNSINVGQGIAILYGIPGEPSLLACSARLAANFTPLGGSATPIIDTQVHIRNLDGSTTDVAVTELTGGEGGVGTDWAAGSNVKNLAYGPGTDGNRYLLVLDFVSRRLDVYRVEPSPPACTKNPFADSDGDSDVDMDDFGAFQACYNPLGTSLTPECVCFDRDDNDRVDLADFGDPQNPQPNTFMGCVSRPGVPADTLCDGAP